MNKNRIKYFLALLTWLLASSAVSAKDNVSLGNAAFNKGNFTEAVSYYENALAVKKSDDVYISLGHARRRLGHWDKAVQAFKSAVETQQKEPAVELLKFLGQAQYMAEHYDEALDTFQHAYSISAASSKK